MPTIPYKNTYITKHGYRFIPDLLDDADDFVLVITPDDFVYKINESMRIRCGAAGTGETTGSSTTLYYDEKEENIPGIYELIKNLPKNIKNELSRRISLKLKYKMFERYSSTIGPNILDDEELRNEIFEMGIEEYLKTI